MDTDKLQNRYIINLGAWMLGLIAFRLYHHRGYTSARIAAVWRATCVRHIPKSGKFFQYRVRAFFHRILITRTTNDITQIQIS
jgi:uncharacterized membrane protein